MSREVHVRCCEQLGGQFPGLTRLLLMGRTIPGEVTDKLKNLLQRMGLKLNVTKTRQINSREKSVDFLGFTIRHDRDIKGRKTKYWNIMPSKKSEQRIRDKIKYYLETHGHCAADIVAKELNTIIIGWLNYFEIRGVSYPAMSKRRLRYYLYDRINRYYTRKSQRKCKLYGHNALGTLISYFGLIDPTKYTLVNF